MHQDASRGASGLTNGVRWQCNLFGLPEKNAKQIIGVSSTEPGQHLALKVCKKNYGPPEPVFYLERLRGGILTPCEPKVRENDADLEDTIKGLVLDAVLIKEKNPQTKRVLIDGYHSTWNKTNSRITRPAIERVIAACLVQGDLYERRGKAVSGRKITYLSRYPEMPDEMGEESEKVFKKNLNRSVDGDRSVGVETSGDFMPTLLNKQELLNKEEVETEKCKTDDPHFVSPCNYDNVEVEKIPPLRGEAKAPPLHAGAMPSPQSVGDQDAEYF